MSVLFVTTISIGPGGALELWGNLTRDTFQELSECDVNVDVTVDTVNSTTIYGALDPVDNVLYRVKVLEKVKPTHATCYTHYRVFKVDVGSQHTIETARLFYLKREMKRARASCFIPSNLAPLGPLALFTHQVLVPLRKRFLRKSIDINQLVLYEKEATGQSDVYTCMVPAVTKCLVENRLAQVYRGLI